MFWKKKEKGANPAGTPQVKETVKKEMSTSEIMINQVEQLTLGQELICQLPKGYGGEQMILALNPEYPKKGRKYNISMQKAVDDKPTGNRSHLWDSNKPKEMVTWLMERGGTKFI